MNSRATMDKARLLYVRDGLTASVIAKRLGVTERTVARWRDLDAARGDAWDHSRAVALLGKEMVEESAQRILINFMQLYEAAQREIMADGGLSTLERVQALNSLADTHVKQVKACAAAAPQLNRLAVANEVLRMLIAFVAEKRPTAAPALLEALEPFGAEVAKAFGGPA